MLKNIAAIIGVSVSVMVLAVQAVQAVPVTNTAGDGIEDVGTGLTAYSWYQNSGEFMFLGGVFGSGSFNDPQDFSSGLLESNVEAWLGITDPSTFSLSVGSGVTFANVDDSGNSVTGASKSGTWTVNSPGQALNFYVVKAAKNYAMYYVNPAEATGSWSTYDLSVAGYGGGGGLEISHFNGYVSNTSEVPEPATMILFGTGLAGLAALRRRKKN